jgi:4-amino-4-deoxy-L-arabinose transferase-like glycosyltransferase
MRNPATIRQHRSRRLGPAPFKKFGTRPGLSAMLNSPLVDTSSLPPIRARSAEEGACRISWLDLLFPAALMLICFFSGIGAIGLTGPDEPRYAAIARAMARTGDWVTPRLNGQPWFEKPALYYWIAGAAFQIFGDGEFAMRLPSVLAAVLATLAASWAALRAYGLDAARLTLLLLPVSVGLIGFSHSASGDMLFAALLTAAAAVAAEMLQQKRTGTLSRISFGFLLGAAVLAKGPAAVLLAGGSVLLWALTSRRFAAAFQFFHPVCLAAFAATAVPWYALCAARNPDFIRVFFFEHNIQRYLTPMFQHPQPLWFFGPVLLLGVFPWTVLAIPLILDAWKAFQSGRWRDSPTLFFACWVLAPLLFFSFSESKLPGYILPAVPPLALILAATLARRLVSPGSSPGIWIGLCALSFPLLAFFAGAWLKRLPAESGLAVPDAWTLPLAVAAAGGLACAALAWTRRYRAAITGVTLVIATLVVVAAQSALPKLDPYLSSRPAAHATAAEIRSTDSLAALGIDHSLQYGLEYYLDRPVPDWTGGTSGLTWVWTIPAGVDDLQRVGFRCTVVRKFSRHAWLVQIDPSTSP